ncbi:MAG: 4Fe-4S dicluster domain-containing protein [Promethearchaeota archaeon]
MPEQIDFQFRNSVLEKYISSTVSYCYQCSSCVSACPIADITEGKYNPRKIIINTLLGLKSKIFEERDPDTWLCTQCCTCDEVCPQKVKLTEIFAFIKNQFAEQFKAPEGYLSEARALYQFGKTVPLQPAIERRRTQLGLSKIVEVDFDEIKSILEMIGLDKLVNIPQQSNQNNQKEGK